MSHSDLDWIQRMPLLRSFFLNHERDGNRIIDQMREHYDNIRSVIIRRKSGPDEGHISMLLKFQGMECFDVVARGSNVSLDFVRLYVKVQSRRAVNLLADEGSFVNNFILYPYFGYIHKIPGLVSVSHRQVHSLINEEKRCTIIEFKLRRDVRYI
jgi:hypothetical protein